MSARKRTLPDGWRPAKLSEILDVDTNVVTPKSGVQYTLVGLEHIEQNTGVITDAPLIDGSQINSTKLVFGPGHVLYGKLRPNLNKVALPDFAGICSTDILPLAPRRGIMREYLAFYLRTPVFVEWARTNASGTKMPRIGVNQLREATIPLPPLPVQERIVQILQKADEIRRKRKEALELADKLLPALFLDMFGDPASNTKGWDSVPLEQVLDACEAGVWGPEATEEGAGYRVLRSTNMPLDGRVDFSDVAVRTVAKERAARFVLEDGDILLNRSSGSKEHIGKLSLFRQPEGHEHPYLFSNFVQRLRVKKGRISPEYLFHFLRTDFARTNLHRAHATSSGLRNINMAEYLRQPVLVPPPNLQEHFARVARQHEGTRSSAKAALDHACRILSALLDRAFTGELTAEWEAANADWIAAQQKLYESLPRRVLLALLDEAARRNRSAVLVTALMKYVFLLQMEANGRRRFYHFVPYHYGPFAKELYADLEQLRQDGLITIHQDAGEEKTRIAVADPARVQQALRELPEDLRADVAAILDQYGQLEHNRLLKTVYEKYPAYAKKSRLLKGASKPTKRAGRSS